MSSITTKSLTPVILVTAVLLACVVGAVLVIQREVAVDAEMKRASDTADALHAATIFALSTGVRDVGRLEADLIDTDSIETFRIVPASGVVARSGEGREDSNPDAAERRALLNAEVTRYASVSETGRERIVRITRPIVASASCLECHGGFTENVPLAAMTVSISRDTGDALIGNLSMVLPVTAGAALVVALLSFLLIVKRTVARPLRRLSAGVNEIAENTGDLTGRVAVGGNDEIGEVSSRIDEVLSFVQTAIGEIKEVSESYGGTAGELERNMEDNLESAERISISLEKVRRTLGDLAKRNWTVSDHVASIFSSSTDLRNRVIEQADIAGRSSKLVGTFMEALEDFSSSVRRGSGLSEEIEKIVQEIDALVRSAAESIADISGRTDELVELGTFMKSTASRTDTLSVNAAIEATHAGDQGGGIRIVAEELKRISESLAGYADRIGDTVDTISGRAGEAMVSMRDSREMCSETGKKIDTAAQSFSEAVRKAASVDAYAKEIHGASDDLLDITGNTCDRAESIRGQVENIDSAAREAAGISRSVVVAVEQLEVEARRIVGLCRRIAGISRKNRENLDRLADDLGRLRT